MRNRLLVGCIAGVVGAVALASPATAAGSISVNHPDGGTVAVTIPDAVFAGKECIEIPVTAVFSGIAQRGSGGFTYYPYVVANISASKAGSSASPLTAYADTTDGDKTVSGSFSACPSSDSPGAYSAYVTFGVGATKAPEAGPIAFTISAAPTTASVAAKAKGSSVMVTGKATTTGKRGPEGVSGEYVVSVKVPKSKGGTGRWTDLGYVSPDEYGAFSVTGSVKGRPAGSPVRLQVTCDPEYCLDVTKTTVVR